MQVSTGDGSVAEIRQAVAAQLERERELASQDGEGADRYIATVRLHMTTSCYKYGEEVVDGSNQGDCKAKDPVASTMTGALFMTTATRDIPVHSGNVSASEEGDAVTSEVCQTEEGDTATCVPTALTTDEYADWVKAELGLELKDKTVADLGNIARIRMAIRQFRCEEKRRCTQRAKAKMAEIKHNDDEVTHAVAALEAEQRTRRQQQATEAREALEVRRRQRSTGGGVRVNEIARVNLVRHVRTTVAATLTDGDDGVSVEAGDGLPRGKKKSTRAPVTYVEGIGGFLLDVLGVWTFDLINVYGQKVTIEACIVEGCTSEFLLGVDVLGQHRATMDFDRGEVRNAERGRGVIIPFRAAEDESDSKAGAVRKAKFTNLHQRANGKALVPAVNTHGGRIKLPSKRELGVWIPVNDDIELLRMHGELQTDRVRGWLDELGDTNTPLDDEGDVIIGTKAKARGYYYLNSYARAVR
ncbi:hypothetical protein PHMEG_0004598 [Phytophthora megakarya]|uniref:Uncharacterized protein n=1 Tax=Phytophthora megakarya TaxID=4795 RepID=A0A225WTF4_9STRA|nr:hypothetical protein PHMEG_0004598 [Phytophthora megakarya]